MFFYIHIPFCRQKCLYCKFALTPRFNDSKIRTYVDALKREMNDFFLSFPDTPIETIYFGGGTPSVLSVTELDEILTVFRGQRGFSHISEISLESNPEDITQVYLAALAALGINRLSLGVQTLNSEALRIVGRSDSNESIFRSLELIAVGPIKNFSIDLIAGLPATVPGQIVSDLETIFSGVTPTHVSLYMLEDESYPKSWKWQLPWEECIRSEYLSGTEWLHSKGLLRYELSNFAQPWFESKHNRSYWNHSSYRGFGLSAASFMDGRRSMNSSSFIGYYQGRKEQEEILTPEALRIERIMFWFRTDGVFLEDIGNIPMMEKMTQEWLLRIYEKKVFLTSTWIFLIDHIIGELI